MNLGSNSESVKPKIMIPGGLKPGPLPDLRSNVSLSRSRSSELFDYKPPPFSSRHFTPPTLPRNLASLGNTPNRNAGKI